MQKTLVFLMLMLPVLAVSCAPAVQQAPQTKAPAGGPLRVEETRSATLPCRNLVERYKEAGQSVQPLKNIASARWTPLRLEGVKPATAEALLISVNRNANKGNPYLARDIYTEITCQQNGVQSEVTLSSNGPVAPVLLERMHDELFKALGVR